MLSIEPNDTIQSANEIDLDSLSPVIITGEIGDNPSLSEPSTDVDFFELELNAGDTLIADIDAISNGSSLNSILSILDKNGNEVARNDDHTFLNAAGIAETEPDPYLSFFATADSSYYVGVSSSNGSSGSYDLELSINAGQGAIVPTESDDTILSANLINLDLSAPVLITGEIDDPVNPNNDVDMFRVQVAAGDTFVADIDAVSNGSPLDSVLTVFDINGNVIVQNQDNTFEAEDGTGSTTEPDPLLTLTPTEDRIYYVGVSSSGNVGYNPLVADSGIGTSSGSYRLRLSINDQFIDNSGTGSISDDGSLT